MLTRSIASDHAAAIPTSDVGTRANHIATPPGFAVNQSENDTNFMMYKSPIITDVIPTIAHALRALPLDQYVAAKGPAI